MGEALHAAFVPVLVLRLRKLIDLLTGGIRRLIWNPPR
jgi:hypothetical protein